MSDKDRKKQGLSETKDLSSDEETEEDESPRDTDDPPVVPPSQASAPPSQNVDATGGATLQSTQNNPPAVPPVAVVPNPAGQTQPTTASRQTGPSTQVQSKGGGKSPSVKPPGGPLLRPLPAGRPLKAPPGLPSVPYGQAIPRRGAVKSLGLPFPSAALLPPGGLPVSVSADSSVVGVAHGNPLPAPASNPGEAPPASLPTPSLRRSPRGAGTGGKRPTKATSGKAKGGHEEKKDDDKDGSPKRQKKNRGR